MAKLVHLSPGDELANGRYRVEREMNRAHVRLMKTQAQVGGAE